VQKLQMKPLEDIKLIVNERDITDIQAYITGPCRYIVIVLKYSRHAIRERSVPMSTRNTRKLPNESAKRIFRYKDIPSKRRKEWRDLCEHFEEGLEFYSRHCTRLVGNYITYRVISDNKVFAYCAKC